MAAGPALSIFPPVEEVRRRRDDVDELIRRSMNMRPTKTWAGRGDSTLPSAKEAAAKSIPSAHRFGVGIAITRDRSPTPTSDRVDRLPPIEEVKTPREDPFQNLLPIQVPKRSPSAATKSRPRRSSSISSRTRNNMSTPSPVQKRAPSPDPSWKQQDSAYGTADNTPASTTTVPVFALERDIPSRSSNRSCVCVPRQNVDGQQVASISSPISNAPTYPKIRRQGSQSSVSTQQGGPTASPERQHRRNPTPVSDISPTSTLGRNSFTPAKRPWTQTPQRQSDLPMRSIFPVFDHQVPLQQQAYYPRTVAPLAVISPDKISRPAYSPAFDSSLLLPKRTDPVYITPPLDLNSLWETSNGRLKIPDPKSFNLKMYKPPVEKGKREKLVFGPRQDEPFYSIVKSHNTTIEGEEHELLIQRHHMTEEDILPVSHIDLQPPPAPTFSKVQHGSPQPDAEQPAQHVATITPILATLHALDSAAKTPQAQTIALVDPNATSPAAAKLAERAVNEATQRESCTLAWTAIDQRNGKYELHHPSLGLFQIATQGDIKSAVELGVVKGATSIAIVNPYASISPASQTHTSPLSAGSAASTAIDREQEVLARLDFQDEVMHIDAAAIQALGNLYLIDVCVSTLLSVAIAEAKRKEDPGLVFDAPPPSLLSLRGATSRKLKQPKIKEISGAASAPSPSPPAAGKPPPKPPKKRKPSPEMLVANSLGLGFEHLADKDELPKITRAILSLLGLSFKSAVYVLGVSVKTMAAIVIGISRMAVSEKF